MMRHEPADLINAYFDETLTPEEHVALSHWLKAAPENRKLFAEASLLHDRLRNTLASESDSQVNAPSSSADIRRLWTKVISFQTAAAILILITGLFSLWLSMGDQTASAAIRELDRIIDHGLQSADRTFHITVESVTPENRDRALFEERRVQKRPPKVPLDQAVLYVRSNNQFVLIRKGDDAQRFITGSDGQQSWAVSPRGPVKVSDDLGEFNRDLPGHETAVPLTDLSEGLEQLKRAYELQFSTLGPEEYATDSGQQVRLLTAIKKPGERGPQRVELIYDANTARILSLRFVQMPYGPDRLDLRLSLANEEPLPLNFFEHTSHHPADAPVERLPSR